MVLFKKQGSVSETVADSAAIDLEAVSYTHLTLPTKA